MKILTLVGTLLVIFVFSIQTIFMLIDSLNYREEVYYPLNAIHYLQVHPTHGHIFTYYRWADYFIWKVPNQKEFVDGRMVHWQQVGSQIESSNAFTEYRMVLCGINSFADLSKKYDIRTVILSNNSQIKNDLVERPLDQLEVFLREKSGRKILPGLVTQLNQNRWKIVFKDSQSIIYTHL